MTFESLGLRTELLSAVQQQGYRDPTPVQSRAIPMILAGGDVMATAQTGTGKTAAFTLPLLHRLMESRRPKRPSVRALVLTPTRELAQQVAESIREYGIHLTLRSTVIHGGVGIGPQETALQRGVDIVVATPGRLLDHAKSRTVDLSAVEILVLDEADRMLDMGFIRDIRRILGLLPAKRQNLLFSATISPEIEDLAAALLRRPQLVEVATRNSVAENVDHTVYRVDRERKAELLAALFHAHGWTQALVFTRTKHGANRLAKKLDRAGISVDAIHGNKSQGARTRALSGFKAGRVRALVATEVAARGLDIDSLPHVVNYELPLVAEDYIHRVGRTARAGLTGRAHSLVCVDEDGLLRDIERLLRRPIRVERVPGFDPDPRIPAEPARVGAARVGAARKGSARPAPVPPRPAAYGRSTTRGGSRRTRSRRSGR